MNRLRQFLLEVVAGLMAAGILAGIGIPLLHALGDTFPGWSRQAFAWIVALTCVGIATARPGGSLRRR
jgi:hypothetical protein